MPVQYGSFLRSAVHPVVKWVLVNMDRDDIVWYFWQLIQCEYFPKEVETCTNDQIPQGVICVNRDIRL